ncbi:MAG: ATP-binding cassette domain-containing protein [Trueperaceae bacterium]|nr:ATP-binding cassette domain-containing protein [Trueperaceae bacterium]
MDECVRLRDVRLVRGPHEVAAGVTWTLAAGERWALWGPNGAGKSTLLALLEGRIAPADGTVRRAPGLRIVTVPQVPSFAPGQTVWEAACAGLRPLRAAEAQVRAEERRLAQGRGDLEAYAALQERFEQEGGWEAEPRLRRELAILLPHPRLHLPVERLSTGERRRLALASALAQRADLLLLDEPTNALDLPARRWLTDRLGRSRTAMIIAGHDRALLGAASTHSARLQDGRLEPVALPFDRDRDRRGVQRRRAERRAHQAAREAARLGASAERARRWGSPAQRGSARTLARRAAEVAWAAPDPEPSTVHAWRLSDSEARRGPVAWARHLSAPGAFEDLSVTLEAGDKVALIGANGSGKSSLLQMLAGVRPSARPDAEAATRAGVTMHLWDAAGRGLDDAPLETQLDRWVPRPRIPQLLALVGLTPAQARSEPATLSGGERARAAVALLVAREPDVVLLDEPEADLDLPALDLLEQALSDARVTVLLATHDVRLAEAVCPDAWSLEEGALIAWRGGVHGWGVGRKRQEGPTEIATAAHDPGPPDPEASLHALEDEDAALSALLEDPTRLSDRERTRLEARRHALMEARMRAYDARLPAPAPRHRALEPPLCLEADRNDQGGLTFTADWPTLPRVRVTGGVAHLTLPDPPNGCWAPWARVRALRAALRVVFEALAPEAVQTPARGPEAPAPFDALTGGWWVVHRADWEARYGLTRAR